MSDAARRQWSGRKSAGFDRFMVEHVGATNWFYREKEVWIAGPRDGTKPPGEEYMTVRPGDTIVKTGKVISIEPGA